MAGQVLDVDPIAPFALVCLNCANLGRDDHETEAKVLIGGPPWVQYRCRTCGATYDLPVATLARP